jgi:signal peptidase II
MRLNSLRRISLVVLVLVTCVGCDQLTKDIAKRSLAVSDPISLLDDSVRFEYTENTGAFLGLGSNLPREVRFLLLVIFTSVTLLALAGFALSAVRLSLAQWVGLSLLAGGGVGNLIDRILNDGAVVDFVRLQLGPLRTGVFNVADVAVMAGALLLLVESAILNKEPTKAQDG